MPFRISIDGIQLEFDSDMEAAALIQQLRSQDKVAAAVSGKKPGKRDFAAFWGSLDDQERIFLRKVADAPDVVHAGTLATELHSDLAGIGWIRRRIKAKAHIAGLSLDRLVMPEKVVVDDKPKTAYRPTDKLKSELAALNGQ